MSKRLYIWTHTHLGILQLADIDYSYDLHG